jgi:hypothetical protein
MALNRTVEIFLNNARTEGRITLRSLTDTNVASFTWIEGDKFRIRLRFADLPPGVGAAAIATRLDGDNVIMLGARARRGSGSLLFSVTDFTETVVAASDATPADYYYDAVINLATAAMPTVFGSNDSVTLWLDVEVQAPDGLSAADPDRLTWQFQVKVNRQAYADDSTPVPATPAYPAPDLLATKAYAVTAADARIALQKGEPDGLAPLGPDGRIDREYLDSAALMSAAGEELINSLKDRYGENAGTFYFSGHGVQGDLLVTSTTGYVRFIHADGSLGAQQAQGYFPQQSYYGAGHRAFGVISVQNGGSVRSGDILDIVLPTGVTSLYSAKLSSRR